MTIFRGIYSFIRRDFLLEWSYRFNFLLRFLGSILFITIFYFINRLFGEKAISYLDSYGTDYFSFVLIGIAFSNYLNWGLSSFSENIRNEQLMGTLETMLVTPTTVSTIIFSSSYWEFIHTTFEILIYLVIGFLLFGAKMTMPNLLAAIVIVILSLISFSSLGIISASFIMVFKRGNPLNWFLTNTFHLFGGVYFPITVLPLWLQKLSHCLPITYSLHGLRFVLIKGASLSDVFPDVLALSIFSVVLLPISMIALGWAVKRAKVNGSLGYY